jgi:hypothetical protein
LATISARIAGRRFAYSADGRMSAGVILV